VRWDTFVSCQHFVAQGQTERDRQTQVPRTASTFVAQGQTDTVQQGVFIRTKISTHHFYAYTCMYINPMYAHVFTYIHTYIHTYNTDYFNICQVISHSAELPIFLYMHACIEHLSDVKEAHVSVCVCVCGCLRKAMV
jgi:hypothetical protein